MTATDHNPLISLEALSKTYRSNGIQVPALKSVSLSIEKGEFVTIAGPSGSGKSTLLHLLGALDSATSGRVVIDDHDLSELSQTELARFRLESIGFVFQAYNLINVLTARENVEYIMLLQGLDAAKRRQRAEEVLVRVGLKEYLDTVPTHMSGGQQQRVAVARAIAANPALVLADEPTANLDSKTGAALIDLFKELQEQYEMTFVIASHDPMVLRKTKRLIELHDGNIIKDEMQ